MKKLNADYFKTGDKIAYSVQFLRSIGESHGSMSHARGTVKEIKSYRTNFHLAVIEWENGKAGPVDPDAPEGCTNVNIQNLAKVGPNSRFANCD